MRPSSTPFSIFGRAAIGVALLSCSGNTPVVHNPAPIPAETLNALARHPPTPEPAITAPAPTAAPVARTIADHPSELCAAMCPRP